MLEQCAPGHQVTEQPHSFKVTFGDRTYPALPRGKRNLPNPEVYLGDVRKMARHLGLDPDCVASSLRQHR